jgi:hypothetical protein
MFSRKLKVMAITLSTVSLLAMNLGVANAHQWWRYHWNKSGPQIVIQNYIYGANATEAEYARQNGWSSIGILYNYSVNYHTDMSVFGGNFGATVGGGLRASRPSIGTGHASATTTSHTRMLASIPTTVAAPAGAATSRVFIARRSRTAGVLTTARPATAWPRATTGQRPTSTAATTTPTSTTCTGITDGEQTHEE